MYYELRSDILAERSITQDAPLPGFGTDFISGVPIQPALPSPLIFPSNFDQRNPPRGMEGMSIPVWSQAFVDLLRSIGIDNFEAFPAIIRGLEEGVEWSDYLAVNVIGLVAATDLSKSKYLEITRTPGAPYLGITDLVIDESKARGLDMFRLAENWTTLVVSQRVIDALRDNPRLGGWGITAFDIES